MARTNKIVSGSADLLKYIEDISDDIEDCLDVAITEVGDDATAIAKETLLHTNHTQKLGDELVYEIGSKKTPDGYIIYAPISNTELMLNQMYYAENGAGVMGGPQWRYATTEFDKTPMRSKENTSRSYTVLTRRGWWMGVTDYSKPAGYMKAARRYIIQNCNRELKDKISYVIGKRQ